MVAVLAGLAGAIITTLITAYINKRSKSGKINTSEAKDLWDALRSELERLQGEATSLRTEMGVARLEMIALREETATLRGHIADLERQLMACKEREKAQVQAPLLDKGIIKDE